MQCSQCGSGNLADSLFCTECGARIEASCPGCGAGNPPTAKFCRKCGALLAESGKLKAESAGSQLDSTTNTRCPSTSSGQVQHESRRDPRSYTPKHLAEKILTLRSALEGERKQVTVLFADVKGSMDLAEQVDPEEWHRIMDRFFAILSEGVHRFEGTVNQYTGDGIMALFGAPIAHEDHPRRACYAALHLGEELRRYAEELKRTKGLNFSVRMGMNSGEVVVGMIGDDLRMDYTAQGQTVGLAARMEQLAEPGRAYVTEYTAKLVEGFFEVRDLGEFDLKGVGRPVRVYELQGVGRLRTRLDVSRARGFSKFVGRMDEMAALEAALERAIQDNGQVIGVVGEAGVGKSRLCYEFIQRCRSRGLTVTEAHGVAHGKTVPFLAVLEYLRGYFGITDQDTEQNAREKIAGKLILLDPDFNETLPLLFDFLGVPDPKRPVVRMDPEARQRQLFAAMKRLTHAQSRQQPGVSVIEDLQWIDAGSEGFLENFVEALAGTRTLLVVNFRPEYHAGWMQRSYYQQMPLLPLGPEALTELLQDLLGADPSLAGLGDRIRERTGGNPFFIEEVVQALVETGSLVGARGAYRLVTPVETVAIPASVQAVLSARMDRLSEREKEVLQTASVIGRNFSEPVLRAVLFPAFEKGGPGGISRDAQIPLNPPLLKGEEDLAASLSSLKRAEYVYEEALYPEAVYAFKHALTQEVAYGSQLTGRRGRLHAAVAQTIAELYPDRVKEQAALIAHHWEEAGEALEAARWHGRAAEWAGTSQLAEALRHWRKVRELLDGLPESAETILLGVMARIQILNAGWRLGATEEEASATFAEGKALAERSGDLRTLSLANLMYAAVAGLGGDPDAYLRYGIEAARVADQTDDAGLQVVCRVPQLTAQWYRGQLREARAAAQAVLERASGDPGLGADVMGFSPYIVASWFRGVISAEMGRNDDSEADVDRAVQLAQQRGDMENLCWAHSVHVYVAEATGCVYSALEHARQAIEIAERIGSPFSRVLARGSLGQAHMLNEDWNQAVGVLERVLEMARQTRAGLLGEASTLANLARAYLGLREDKRARATVDEAIAVARRRGTKYFECVANLTCARVLLRTEGPAASADIQAALKEAQTLVEETGGRSQEPFIHEELAELARITGDETTRNHELREAHRLFTEMGATGHAERLAKVLKGARVPKRKFPAQKPKAKGRAKGAEPGKKRKPVRQTAKRKSKK